MKKSIIMLLVSFIFCQISWAHSQSYQNLSTVICISENKNQLILDLNKKTINGFISDSEKSLRLTNNEEGLALKDVKVTENFLGCGYAMLGGVAVASNDESFGTYGLILDKDLQEFHQDMTVVYVDSATGQLIDKIMECTFVQK